MAHGLVARLDALAGRGDDTRLDSDPLGVVRTARDREAAALLGAALAFGRVRQIRASLRRALLALDGDRAVLDGFRHRWIDGGDVAALLDGIARARGEYGSLEGLFRAGDDGDLATALDRFADALRGDAPSRGLRFLLPRPRDGSACKRPLLFLRWVARPGGAADLGLWHSLAPARLIVPLDTHVHRIAYGLGWTDRKTPSWRAAIDVTNALRRLDPADPVRFDFALAHLGIAGDCPRRRAPAICGRCNLRDYCRWFRSTT